MKSKNTRTGVSLGKKVMTTALCLVMAYSTVGTAISASAIQQLAPSSKLGANGSKYYSQYSSNEELLAATREANVDMVVEGAILLKNGGGENGNENKLPYTDMKNVSVFGINSDAYGYGGTGSGSGQLEEGADIYTSFENAGININPKLKALYQKYSGGSLSATAKYTTPTYEDKELSLDYYTEAVQATYEKYNDAALVVISRLGGEGADLATENVQNRVRPDENGNLVADPTEHYLELSYNEEQMLKHVKENFDKVVVLFNSGNAIEMGELQNDPGIDAIVHIGQTGDYGFDGILKLLKGEANPSGRTVDIYTTDFTVDPTYQNLGNGSQTVETGTNYTLTYKANTDANATSLGTNSVEYEEGIYLGYKYYETMYSEIKAGNVDLTAEATKAVLGSKDLGFDYVDADDWYNKNVVYPFGYGLSYTSFEWTFDGLEMSTEKLTKDTVFTAKVTVENTGDFAGKDVVELYMSAPYTVGGIEKASTQLLGFAKTPVLEAGESATVEIVFDAYDIAAYDWSDANDNNFAGYEIEAGKYVFTANKNSHDVVDAQELTLDALKLENSQATGVKVENRFIDSPNPDAKYDYTSISPTMTIMSRANMVDTFPTAPTDDELTYEPGADNYNKAIVDGLDKAVVGDMSLTEEEVYTKVNYGYIFGGEYDGSAELWAENAVIPDTWTQAADENEKVVLRLPDMMGISPYSTAVIESENKELDGLTGVQAWEKFLNQLTYEELKLLVHTGFFKTAGIDRIGKEEAVDPDGPCTIGGQTKDGYISQRGSSGTRYWSSMQMLAASWNLELAYVRGSYIGEEALWNNYNGWYAPSMNIHRSPFSGRNFEYFSQDAVQSGLISSALLKATTEHGVYPYLKHFALNDQETSRNNIATWADEQTIRENYLKTFQYAIEQGGACGIMTGFNRIGMIDCPENYALMTQILREEWGFDGSVVTDYQVGTVGATHNNMEVFHYAGTNIPLSDKNVSARGQGQWDTTLRGGKGGVKVGQVTFKESTDRWGNIVLTPVYSAEKFLTVDDTDNKAAVIAYYYTRTRAMELLYTHVRSNAIDNGADFQKNFAGGTIKLPGGVNNVTVALPLNFDADADISIELVSSNLPANVSYNANNTSFTVRNATTGAVGTIKLKAVYDGWASKTVTYNVEIVPAAQLNGATSIEKGADYSATVSQNFWEANPNLGKEELGVVSVVPSVKGLPEGLTFDAATSTISGTAPTTAGEYNITVTYTVTMRTFNAWFGYRDTAVAYNANYTLTVGHFATVTIDGKAQKVEIGATITAPEVPVAPKGQRFVGWFVGETEFDFDTAITADTEIIAKFEDVEPQFRVNEDGMIQYSEDGGNTWIDVIDKSELKGDKGDKGDIGDTGAPGVDGVDGADGADGKDGVDATGCGSVVGTTSTLVATMVLGAVVLVLRKKED